MKKLKFQIQINAPKETVWNVLWDDQSYRQWTFVFSPGSRAKSDWEKGSRIEFVNETGDGMYALIEEKIPNAQMVFLHQGEIKNGKDTPGDWGQSREAYFLSEQNGQTELNVELDSPEAFQEYFADTFPKALQLVKELSENAAK